MYWVSLAGPGRPAISPRLRGEIGVRDGRGVSKRLERGGC